MSRQKICIVVPLYNEESVVPSLAVALKKVVYQLVKDYDVETLLVDDGSTDGTRDALGRVAPDLHGQILVHDRNRRGLRRESY